jgi:Superinfection immunity protein
MQERWYGILGSLGGLGLLVANAAGGGVGGLLLGLVALGLYGLPSLIAMARGHHQVAAIVALNLLLGWTCLGWVVAVVWALTALKPVPKEVAMG